MARAAKSVEVACRTPRLRHRVALGGAALIGLLFAGTAGWDLHSESKDHVEFAQDMQLGPDNNSSLTAAHDTQLPPQYQQLNPWPMILGPQKEFTNDELVLGTIGMSLAIGALALPWVGKQLHTSRTQAREALQAQITNSTLQWPGHYTHPNEDTLDAIFDGRQPKPDPELVAAYEARQYSSAAATFGLGPDASPAAVLEGVTTGLGLPYVSPLSRPIRIPALDSQRHIAYV